MLANNSANADLAPFKWDDAFLVDHQLSEEERLLRDAANAFAQDKLQPRIVQAYADEATDPEIFREMGRAGDSSVLRSRKPTAVSALAT